MIFFKNALLVLSILIVVFSLWPTRRLMTDLPSGRNRRYWYLLSCLICLFVVGYTTYAIFFWSDYQDSRDLIVPFVFLGGAAFVLLISTLSLRTSLELRRIYELEHENITDPLMGIWNRRYMERRLVQEFHRAKRYHHPFSIIMIDIDHFKRINDSCGHRVGDVVLKEFAELVVSTVRDSDVVCRYGGGRNS